MSDGSWTDQNYTAPDGDNGQAAENNTAGFGGAANNNTSSFGIAHHQSYGHARGANLVGTGSTPPADYKLIFPAEIEYGYVAFTTEVTVIGNCTISFKCPSFVDGFYLLGRDNANRSISLNASSVDVRLGATTYNIPTTLPNTGDCSIVRVGSVISVYNNGVLSGSLDTTVTLNLIYDFIGKTALTANTDFYKEGQVEYININSQVEYLIDNNTGNLDDNIGANTGILSTQGTGLPTYQAI